MKSKIILSLSIFIPFALVFLYIWTTATDLVFRDDMYLIKGGFIESYLRGNLTFADLWRPSNSMRILGGALIYIADVKWFSMNLKMITLLIPFFILASALLIYREYRKSLIQEHSPEFIAVSYFILSFIIFNVIQWEGFIYGGSIGFQYPIPFMIAGFISLESFFLKGGLKYLFAVFILLPMALLVFGGRLGFVFVPTLCSVFICYLITHRFRLTNYFWLRACAIGLFLAAVVSIYLFRIDYNDYVLLSLDYADDLFNVLSLPLNALQFILAAFGAGGIGVDVFFACDYLSFNTIIIIGLIIVFLYALALIFFFKYRMYEKTYLPLFLIMQTFFYLSFMLIGRFRLGNIDYGMSSRYTSISLYGLAAMVWIFIFTLTRSGRLNVFLKGIIYGGFTIIFTGLLLTTIFEWRIRPARQAYFAQLHQIALHVDTATPEELSRFAERPEVIRESLRLLREYKMNVYRAKPNDGN